ncbi:SUKH-4 family immunity protein [Rossellomorea vietnamensis]|uniref:SUKH-4 family immunity protein n=1 Tax=Rossellomorea vietnamensis TaxID=218284 RepID=UPI002D1FB46A|nr:SUKH-4 family immunity protein [Rossellomorea vietnamensis]MCC5803776.1 SUKH-4 family immunity protein [Rossellomorea vietnamensis]
MILPEEFNDKWDIKNNGPLIKVNSKDLSNLNFSNQLKEFLSVGGIPETPPPYLELTSSEAFLRPITDTFDMPEEFRKYWFLGSNGNGDPICIVEDHEHIVFLNSSDQYKEVFINSSLNQFAECLLSYSLMIDKAIEINGEDAYIDNDIPDSTLNWLRKEIERIDSKSMEDECFWSFEIHNLCES